MEKPLGNEWVFNGREELKWVFSWRRREERRERQVLQAGGLGGLGGGGRPWRGAGAGGGRGRRRARSWRAWRGWRAWRRRRRSSASRSRARSSATAPRGTGIPWRCITRANSWTGRRWDALSHDPEAYPPLPLPLALLLPVFRTPQGYGGRLRRLVLTLGMRRRLPVRQLFGPRDTLQVQARRPSGHPGLGPRSEGHVYRRGADPEHPPPHGVRRARRRWRDPPQG